MDMIPVSSSQISHVGYDLTSRTLTVRFKNGGLYHYTDVPPDEHAALMQADADPAQSVGSHFHKHIRGAFAYRGVE